MPGATSAIDTSWSVSAEPELVIGVRAGDPRYEFFRVSGVAQRPAGRMAVVIHGTHEVRLYDEEGGYLHSLGGRGGGPGEFVGPNLIPARTHDSLLVADARRISVIGEDDSVRVVGSIRVPFLPALSVGQGILFRGSASSGRPASNGLVTGRIQYRLVDLQDDQSVVIADVTSRTTFSVPGDRGGRLGGSIPFTVPPSHAPASRGVYLAQVGAGFVSVGLDRVLTRLERVESALIFQAAIHLIS